MPRDSENIEMQSPAKSLHNGAMPLYEKTQRKFIKNSFAFFIIWKILLPFFEQTKIFVLI